MASHAIRLSARSRSRPVVLSSFPQLMGGPLTTSFSTQFDLRFAPTDKGTLEIEASFEDFDTATTITYRDTLDVRP